MSALFTLSLVDTQHGSSVEHTLDISLIVKIEVGSADGEPHIGNPGIYIGYM